MILYLNISLR